MAEPEKPSLESIFTGSQLQALLVPVAQLRRAARTDLILGRVYQYNLRGWLDQVPKALKPFESQQSNLTLGFSRSLHGTHLSHCSGCTLQVARSGADDYHRFGSHNHRAVTDVFGLWSTATTHHR